MFRPIHRPLVVLMTLALAVASAVTTLPLLAQPAAQPGTVTLEWLGHNAWRFTSPTGKVVLANPFVTNPDSPISVDRIDRADLILVTDGHSDEVGQTIEIAQNTGARVMAGSWGLGGWFIDMGLPATQVSRTSPGGRDRSDGITVRVLNGIHGSDIGRPTSTTPSGGIAASFMVTFENGWSIFYSGSSAATQDMAMWAQMYKPDAAVVQLSGSREPMDFAMVVKLLMTDNPNLNAVFPGHHRFVQGPGQTTVAEAQAAMDAMGTGLTITEPVPGVSYLSLDIDCSPAVIRAG